MEEMGEGTPTAAEVSNVPTEAFQTAEVSQSAKGSQSAEVSQLAEVPQLAEVSNGEARNITSIYLCWGLILDLGNTGGRDYTYEQTSPDIATPTGV